MNSDADVVDYHMQMLQTYFFQYWLCVRLEMLIYKNQYNGVPLGGHPLLYVMFDTLLQS